MLFPGKTLLMSTLTVMMLGKVGRNKVYEAIAESGLDPAECELVLADDKALITHESGSTFEFERDYRRMRDPIFRFKVNAAVADSSVRNFFTPCTIWDISKSIREWADEVKLIVDMPDRWAESRRSREFITSIQRQYSANAPFTQDEQEQIEARVQEIKKQLEQQFELSSEQMTLIDEKLEEAVEASTRMGRKDWLIYSLGTITALIITATVTAGVGEHIFAMVIHGLAHLFTGGNEPPRILT